MNEREAKKPGGEGRVRRFLDRIDNPVTFVAIVAAATAYLLYIAFRG